MDFLRVTVCVNLNLLRQLPAEGLVQQGFFEVVEGGEFLAVDGLQSLNRFFGLFNFNNDLFLIIDGR